MENQIQDQFYADGTQIWRASLDSAFSDTEILNPGHLHCLEQFQESIFGPQERSASFHSAKIVLEYRPKTSTAVIGDPILMRETI